MILMKTMITSQTGEGETKVAQIETNGLNSSMDLSRDLWRWIPLHSTEPHVCRMGKSFSKLGPPFLSGGFITHLPLTRPKSKLKKIINATMMIKTASTVEARGLMEMVLKLLIPVTLCLRATLWQQLWICFSNAITWLLSKVWSAIKWLWTPYSPSLIWFLTG